MNTKRIERNTEKRNGKQDQETFKCEQLLQRFCLTLGVQGVDELSKNNFQIGSESGSKTDETIIWGPTFD